MAGHFRLLVDFLGHEVAIIRLCRPAGRRPAVLDARRGARPSLSSSQNSAPLRVSTDPVAILEIADGVGERRQRDRVGAQIHLAVAIADRQRRAVARADHQIVLALEQEPERERAAQAATAPPSTASTGPTPCVELSVDQMQARFRCRSRLRRRALGLELLAQLAEILDDAVVDHGDAFGGVRMGVVLGRLAVGRPAGVADAGRGPSSGCGFELGFEVSQFAFGAAARRAGRPPAWRRRRNHSRDIPGASAPRRSAPRPARVPRIPTMPHMISTLGPAIREGSKP